MRHVKRLEIYCTGFEVYMCEKLGTFHEEREQCVMYDCYLKTHENLLADRTMNHDHKMSYKINDITFSIPDASSSFNTLAA